VANFNSDQAPYSPRSFWPTRSTALSPAPKPLSLRTMQEGQVTVEGETHPLPQPFLVLATQNPIEYEGHFSPA
jgi:hypothetical protein